MPTKYINSNNLSLFLAAVILVFHYYVRDKIYNHWENPLGWDALGYYIYLPFTFIYHDPGIANHALAEHLLHQYNLSGTFYQVWQLPNGNWVSMYTLGFALLWSPFFFIGHCWALLSGGAYPADGFSFPYRYCIANGVMIYIVAGVFLLRKVLLRFFPDGITMLVMLLLVLGTNYFHEVTSDEMGPHAILFTAYCLILWLTIKWHEKPAAKTAAWLGFIMGFVILSRGTEILSVLIPMLWNVYDKASLKSKTAVLWNNKSHVLIALLCAFIVPAIQIIQWKYVTGDFIFSFYKNYEPFDWDGQHILKVLFSYKKGWFLYTPMVVLPIIGILELRKQRKEIFWPVLLFLFLNFYLLASMSAWWQGTGYGMRYFVQSYVILAIPFGFFLKRVGESNFLAKSIVALIAGFLLFLNLFQMWQYNHWILHGYAMTKAYYWKVFLKTSASAEDKKLMEVQRTFETNQPFTNQEDYKKRTIGYFNFDSINTAPVDSFFLDSTLSVSPPYSCKLTKEHIYSPSVSIPFNEITSHEHAFIRVTLDYYPKYDLKENPAVLVITMEHKPHFSGGRSLNGYRGYGLGDQPFKLGEWNRMSVDYLTPYPQSEKDKLIVYIYIQGNKEINIDNLHVEAFERKW